ncbi:MAG: hypothetical protein ABUL73_02255 [Alphaproteobacteria bacterium]
MIQLEWFGWKARASPLILLATAAVAFLACAGLAWIIGKMAGVHGKPLLISLGGGAVLFVIFATLGVLAFTQFAPD